MPVTNHLGSAISAPASLNLRSVWFEDVRCAPSGQVEMTVCGEPGDVWRIQTSTNLVDWHTVCTMTNVSGATPFVDTEATNYGLRFYRCIAP